MEGGNSPELIGTWDCLEDRSHANRIWIPNDGGDTTVTLWLLFIVESTCNWFNIKLRDGLGIIYRPGVSVIKYTCQFFKCLIFLS